MKTSRDFYRSAALIFVYVVGVALMTQAGAQVIPSIGGSAGASDLCFSSNAQSLALSGVPGNPATRFASVVCDTVLNAYIIQIFNGAEAISCTGTPSNTALTFTVDMSCTGPENGNRGITGHLSIPINTTTESFTSAVSVPYGMTSSGLQVVPSSAGSLLADRTCVLTLRADLYALRPGTDGQCVSCISQPVLSITDTCGAQQVEDDCNFFNVICRFYNGTWANSAFFWIIFYMLIPAVMGIIFLAYKNARMTRLLRLHRLIKQKGMDTPGDRNNQQMFVDSIEAKASGISRAHGATGPSVHGGSHYATRISTPLTNVEVANPLSFEWRTHGGAHFPAKARGGDHSDIRNRRRRQQQDPSAVSDRSYPRRHAKVAIVRETTTRPSLTDDDDDDDDDDDNNKSTEEVLSVAELLDRSECTPMHVDDLLGKD
jgi:hypothetical protein